MATADALAPVADRLAGAVPVLVDGGVRSGLDVVTALGLGADLVLLGRPAVWALVDGEQGVARLHRELRAEVEETLRLAGCLNVSGTRGIVLPSGATSR